MKSKIKLRVASLTALTILTACGGGTDSNGSNTSTSDPVAKVCSNGASDYPICTPPFIQADLQTAVDKPPFADGSEDLRAFNFLNDMRSSLGLGKLSYSPELTKSATNHALYVKTNKIFDHIENASLSGFTGVSVVDRVKFAGYLSNNVFEVMSSSNTKTGAVERLLGSVYHRSILLKQSIRDVGSASIIETDITGLVINTGYLNSPQRNASDFVMTYPKDGQTNVNLSMCSESPWPFPDIKAEEACTNTRFVNGLPVSDMKVGYPVSIAIQDTKNLNVTKFDMFESGSNTPINVWLTTKTDTTFPVPKNEAYITAKAGLKPSTKYEVSFTGNVDGRSFTKTWSFTTASYLYSN